MSVAKSSRNLVFFMGIILANNHLSACTTVDCQRLLVHIENILESDTVKYNCCCTTSEGTFFLKLQITILLFFFKSNL